MFMKRPRRRITLLPRAAATLLFVAMQGCGDRAPAPQPPVPKTTAAPVAPSTGTAPSSSATSTSSPVIAPGTAEDVNKKGTATGMIGGESGDVAASGKPGSGTDSGAGTGAAQASGAKTTNKK